MHKYLATRLASSRCLTSVALQRYLWKRSRLETSRLLSIPRMPSTQISVTSCSRPRLELLLENHICWRSLDEWPTLYAWVLHHTVVFVRIELCCRFIAIVGQTHLLNEKLMLRCGSTFGVAANIIALSTTSCCSLYNARSFAPCFNLYLPLRYYYTVLVVKGQTEWVTLE